MLTEKWLDGWKCSEPGVGEIIFHNEGCGRYLISEKVYKGKGPQGLELLRQSYSFMFENTDCLVIIARIMRDNPYVANQAQQIPGYEKLPDVGEYWVYRWTLKKHYETKGIELDEDILDKKRTRRVKNVKSSRVG